MKIVNNDNAGYNELVSVIVPMYNSEKYIERCISSILKQSYTFIELILVDDGSIDETEKICAKYQKKDKRIKYFYQDNAGPDYARKKGIKESSGNLLVFVDADDFIDSAMVERMCSEMMEENADLICCQIGRTDGKQKSGIESKMRDEKVISTSVSNHLHHYFATRIINSSYGSKLIKKDFLSNYQYLKDSVIGEDVSIILYILQKAKKVVILNNIYYYYFWNGKSISHSGYSDRHGISLKNYIRVKEELLHKKIAESAEVNGFFAEYEMAVATAMSRNWNISKEILDLLRKDLKKYKRDILKNSYTAFYMKACILMFIYLPYLFMFLYSILYRLTGR